MNQIFEQRDENRSYLRVDIENGKVTKSDREAVLKAIDNKMVFCVFYTKGGKTAFFYFDDKVLGNEGKWKYYFNQQGMAKMSESFKAFVQEVEATLTAKYGEFIRNRYLTKEGTIDIYKINMNKSNVKASEVKDSNLGAKKVVLNGINIMNYKNVKAFNKEVVDNYLNQNRLVNMEQMAEFYNGGDRYYAQHIVVELEDGETKELRTSVRDINDIVWALYDIVEKEDRHIKQIETNDYSYSPYINEDGEEEETDVEDEYYTFVAMTDDEHTALELIFNDNKEVLDNYSDYDSCCEVRDNRLYLSHQYVNRKYSIALKVENVYIIRTMLSSMRDVAEALNTLAIFESCGK